MKLSNFTFNQDLISIEIQGEYLDLHNNFDYLGHRESSKEVLLSWCLTKGDWVPENYPERLKIISLQAWHPLILISQLLNGTGYSHKQS